MEGVIETEAEFVIGTSEEKPKFWSISSATGFVEDPCQATHFVSEEVAERTLKALAGEVEIYRHVIARGDDIISQMSGKEFAKVLKGDVILLRLDNVEEITFGEQFLVAKMDDNVEIQAMSQDEYDAIKKEEPE